MTNRYIKNLYKKSETAEELYDFFDDDTVNIYNNYQSNKNDFEVIDYDALEKGEIPTVEIEDDEEFLTDTYDEDKTIEEQEGIDREFDEKMEEPYEPPFVGEDIPAFGNSVGAINYAVKNNKVLKIDYNTKKGIKLTRYIEPHLVYNSKKGDLIVVTYDRSVRDIRSFIVNNIVNYTFTGKDFKERMKVIPKKEKGIETMSNVNDKLTKVAMELKEKGLVKSSIVVEDVKNVIKEAQYTGAYLGAQGYWIRNRRCWDNCYRHKRTTEPKKAAQEVWMECWDEYLKSINNPKDKWAKYADREIKGLLLKAAVNSKEKELNKKFAEEVNEKMNKGMGLPESIYDILNTKEEEYKNKIIEQASNLTELAVSLNENGFEDLSVKVAEASNEVLKEAGFFGWMGEKVKDWASKKGKLLKYIREIADTATDLSRRLRQQLRYKKQPKGALNKKKMKESAISEVGQTAGEGQAPAGNGRVTNNQVPQPTQQQDYRINYIQEAQNLVADTSELITWMGQSVPQNNPRVKNIVQTALFNLTNANKSLNNLILGGDINIGALIKEVDNMTNAANSAMFSLYEEPTGEDRNQDGIEDTQQVDQNQNNIDDRIEAKPQPWSGVGTINNKYLNSLVAVLNNEQKEYLKTIL